MAVCGGEIHPCRGGRRGNGGVTFAIEEDGGVNRAAGGYLRLKLMDGLGWPFFWFGGRRWDFNLLCVNGCCCCVELALFEIGEGGECENGDDVP